MKSLLYTASLTALCLTLFLAGAAGFSSCKSHDTDTVACDTDTVAAPIDQGGACIKTYVVVSEAVADKESGTYSFEVKAEKRDNCPGDIIYSVTVKGEGDKELARNTTGQFSGLEGLKNDGIYVVSAIIPGVDTVALEIGGCRPLPKGAPLTKEWLQKEINALKKGNADSPLMSNNEKIDPNYTFKFTNLAADDNEPKMFSSIAKKFMFEEWADATVDKIDYDEFGRISVITLTIKY